MMHDPSQHASDLLGAIPQEVLDQRRGSVRVCGWPAFPNPA